MDVQVCHTRPLDRGRMSVGRLYPIAVTCSAAKTDSKVASSAAHESGPFSHMLRLSYSHVMSRKVVMGLHGLGGHGNGWPHRQGCLHSQVLGAAFSAGKETGGRSVTAWRLIGEYTALRVQWWRTVETCHGRFLSNLGQPRLTSQANVNVRMKDGITDVGPHDFGDNRA